MHPHEIHHLKTYIVFFMVSAACIGILMYLYLPTTTGENTLSSVINQEKNADSQEVWGVEKINQNIGSQSVWEDSSNEASTKRIRLTKVLIRLQKELQMLERQRSESPQGLDSALEEKITKLRDKIGTMEKMIIDTK